MKETKFHFWFVVFFFFLYFNFCIPIESTHTRYSTGGNLRKAAVVKPTQNVSIDLIELQCGFDSLLLLLNINGKSDW